MTSPTDKLSKNFTRAELDCNCGCGFIPTSEAISKLQELRDAWNKPMNISSAARCRKYNDSIGGAKDSQHVHGLAFDFILPTSTRWDFVKLAASLGWHGIGVANSFIHLDLRSHDKAAVWIYSNK